MKLAIGFEPCQLAGELKTHLRGKKLDLAQLGKAIVDAATKEKKKKITPKPRKLDGKRKGKSLG